MNTQPDWLNTAPAAFLLEANEKVSREDFCWPTPPYANYSAPMAQTEPMPCEITGPNERRTTARLTFFVPEEEVAHVQIPGSRHTLPLRFGQFRSLTLTTPLIPLPPAATDPHHDILGQPASMGFRVLLREGGELSGETVGHVETAFGLFLFPPVAPDGGVLRQFIPRVAFDSFELGPRIGEVLVAQMRATPLQVEQAMDMQKGQRGQKLGEILLTGEVVSPNQLLEAIERQAQMPMVRIGEALISLGLINQVQLKDALARQQTDRKEPLGEVLVRMGVVSRSDLQVALARKMGYPLVDLDTFPGETEALQKISYTVARRLQIMPLLLREGRLIVAMDDPARGRAAIEEAEFIAKMKIVPVLSQCRSFDQVLLDVYGKIGASPDAVAIEEDPHPAGFGLADTDKLIEMLEKEGQQRGGADEEVAIKESDNSLVRLINNMIIEAHKEGVSDIHIESYPGHEKIRIRFRKDGLLRTYIELPANYRNAMIARIKIMCDLDISERRRAQDGKISFAKFAPQHKLELRVATIPTNSGLEDVVMRILASAKPIPLDRLNLSEYNLTEFKRAIERPYGLVLCVGPTGSGKTTTLHSALSHVNVPERKIWTAEDPIEITQPGLRQVQMNPKIEWTFARALRSFLRADPDVIMVGEVRDKETAQMAIEASLTGHLVLSTLHTNSAPETVTRLLDMGMDPFNFADSLLAVLAQRLVRRLCMGCRSSRPATEEEVDELLSDYMHAFGAAATPAGRQTVHSGWLQRSSRDGRLQVHSSPGCSQCDNTGFKGRVGLHELMVISRELRRMVQTGARAEALQEVAMREGLRTLRQDGIDKALAGLTTIDQVRATSNT